MTLFHTFFYTLRYGYAGSGEVSIFYTTSNNIYHTRSEPYYRNQFAHTQNKIYAINKPNNVFHVVGQYMLCINGILFSTACTAGRIDPQIKP